MKKRILAALLCLCMIAALLPALEVGVFAEGETGYVQLTSDESSKITLTTTGDASASGTGWSWKMCGSRGLLTLTGCTLNSIKLPCDADIYLVGGNKVTYDSGSGADPSLSGKSIVIAGSGRLEMPIFRSYGSLTINGGILDTKRINVSYNITLNDGLIKTNYCYNVGSKLTVNGGSLKVINNTEFNILSSDTVTINGGYVEVNGSYTGITANFINNGGVVKIGANMNGINGNAAFNGGVTIINWGKVTGTITTANSEKLYAIDSNTEIALDTDGKTNANYLVAAKGVTNDTTAMSLTLDGTYVKTCSLSLAEINVVGSSYIEPNMLDSPLLILGAGTLVFGDDLGGDLLRERVAVMSKALQIVGLMNLVLGTGDSTSSDKTTVNSEIICFGKLDMVNINMQNNIIVSGNANCNIKYSNIKDSEVTVNVEGNTADFSSSTFQDSALTSICSSFISTDTSLSNTIYNASFPYPSASVSYDYKTGAVMTGLPDDVKLQWYDSDDNPVDEDKLLNDKPCTLRTTCANAYAIYGVKSYISQLIITFDPCGGVCDETTKTVGYNKAIGELPIPTYEGHIFTGWFLADGINQIGDDSILHESVTLYAHWHDIPVITFIVNGEEYHKTTIGENGVIADYPEDPTYEGHRFSGWFLADGATPVDEETEFTGSVTLYAHWYPVVTLDNNGGSGKNTVLTVGDDNKLTQPLPTPTRSGYRFMGWYTSDGTQVDEDMIFNVSTTIYAKWERYATGGWIIMPMLPNYALTFDTNCGDTIQPLLRAYYSTVSLKNITPVREGFAFGGWYADALLTEPVTSVFITANTTVYAGWTAIAP